MNSYNPNQPPEYNGGNPLHSSPSYFRPTQEHSMAENTANQRQFQFWGPWLGGLLRPPVRPPGPPLGPPPGPPGGQPPSGPPTAPPPAFTPAAPPDVALYAVDPGAIRRCLYQYTYVWLTNRQQFWFYPVFVGRTSVAGYRWTGFFWVYFGVDLRQIHSFQCF